VYVNDAFGAAHRAHGSTAGVPAILSVTGPGFLMDAEIEAFSEVLENPKHPFVAVIGGAKVEDKIKVIRNLLDKVDTLIIGGAMAYTFQKSAGRDVGGSKVEDGELDLAREIVAAAKEKKVGLELPVDDIIADKFAADAATKTVDGSASIPADWMGLDIGPKTREAFAKILADAKTVIWNGPMGVCEYDAFAGGTLAVGRAIADADCFSVVGGGDSVAAVNKLGISDDISHISTGGGACLDMLAGKDLPGLTALK
jgi:phosphoglycerate kinase